MPWILELVLANSSRSRMLMAQIETNSVAVMVSREGALLAKPSRLKT